MSRRLVLRTAVLAALLVGGVVGGVRALGPASTTAPLPGPLGDCRIGERITPHAGPADWARTLLDPEYRLPDAYAPADLVPIGGAGVDGTGKLRALVLDDLAAMAMDAQKAGSGFRVTSAYRDYADQERTFATLVAQFGFDVAARSAARPGHSEHQLGTAVDVEGDEEWLAGNAWRYGFVVSYPQEHSPWSTCYKAEPWHLRYLGRGAARDVADSGLSLRAWLWAHQTD